MFLALGIFATEEEKNNNVKYAGLSSQGVFVPIAVKSHGPINRDDLQFLGKFGSSGDNRGCSSIFVFVSTDFRCGATF